MSLLEVEGLAVGFDVRDGLGRKRLLRAVNGVSLRIAAGESLGLVGESGSGKTTLGRAILGLVPMAHGVVRFEGQDLRGLGHEEWLAVRRKAQMVFQDPFDSLNPRLSVGAAIGEVLRVHHLAAKGAVMTRVGELLALVGLDPEYAARYPHEFSGGQRQRIGIARALAAGPALIIADEPVSALDVSVQVQILNLMRRLQRDMQLAYLFIAHDLSVVRYMCDRVLVMYLGRIVEEGRTEDLFVRTAHPYTEALLSAVPDIERGLRSRHGRSERIVLKGDVPSAVQIPAGCPFHTRCHRAQPVCRERMPPHSEVTPEHWSDCHFAEEIMRQSLTGRRATPAA
jgi:oligopeptide/dipeptide ABC transporter ATP-binding protein